MTPESGRQTDEDALEPGLPRRKRSKIESKPKPTHNTAAPSTLDALPAELLLSITDHLPAESRTALTLLTHRTLHKLGSRPLTTMRPFARWQLLEWLHRDGTYLPDVFCRDCKVFHSPQPTPEWNTLFTRRKCERSSRIVPGEMKHLPPQVWTHPRVAAAVACHEKGVAVERFGPGSLNSHHVAETRGWKLDVREEFKVVEGRLLHRTTRKLAFNPCDGDMDQCRWMGSILENYVLGKICPHQRWRENFPEAFGPVEWSFLSPARWFGPGRHGCVWTHPLGCRCARWYDPRAVRFGKADGDGHRHCAHCLTDFAVRFSDEDEGPSDPETTHTSPSPRRSHLGAAPRPAGVVVGAWPTDVPVHLPGL
jgi:hypothetical protein